MITLLPDIRQKAFVTNIVFVYILVVKQLLQLFFLLTTSHETCSYHGKHCFYDTKSLIIENALHFHDKALCNTLLISAKRFGKHFQIGFHDG